MSVTAFMTVVTDESNEKVHDELIRPIDRLDLSLRSGVPDESRRAPGGERGAVQGPARPCFGVRVVACAVLMVVLAACGGKPKTQSSRDTSVLPPSSVSTTSPTVSTSAAVLTGYRAEWAAFEQALSTADAFDPALAATMVDPALQLVRRNLVADNADGIVGRGSVAVHPRVTKLTATSATVVDCAYSTSELVYAKTGLPVPPATPHENDGVTAVLVLRGTTWKVAQQTITEGTCAGSP